MNHFPKKSLRILLKALILFIVFNFAFELVPDTLLWRVTLYNTVLTGTTRFPLESDLDLLFGVHEIAVSPRQPNQYKVVMLGDSSTWGYLLNPDETLSSDINASALATCQGQPVHLYNLGYPGPSVFRDLLILQRALAYHPQLIIWNVTLLSMYRTQTDYRDGLIVRNNVDLARDLISRYGLEKTLGPAPATASQNGTFLDRREEIARVLQYQLQGIRWQATGGEPVGKGYVRLGMDVSASPVFEFSGLQPPTLNPDLIQSDVLNAGILMAGDTPIIILNQPIQVVNGKNSNIRYDELYPRWVFDQYRQIMLAKAQQYHWSYLDEWNALPAAQFSDSAVHRTAQGEKNLARILEPVIQKNACP